MNQLRKGDDFPYKDIAKKVLSKIDYLQGRKLPYR
jgi:hypothetical protein